MARRQDIKDILSAKVFASGKYPELINLATEYTGDIFPMTVIHSDDYVIAYNFEDLYNTIFNRWYYDATRAAGGKELEFKQAEIYIRNELERIISLEGKYGRPFEIKCSLSYRCKNKYFSLIPHISNDNREQFGPMIQYTLE